MPLVLISITGETISRCGRWLAANSQCGAVRIHGWASRCSGDKDSATRSAREAFRLWTRPSGTYRYTRYFWSQAVDGKRISFGDMYLYIIKYIGIDIFPLFIVIYTRVDWLQINFTWQIDNLPAPHGDCAWKQLRHTMYYSTEECYMDCLTRHAENVCGCRDIYMHGGNGNNFQYYRNTSTTIYYFLYVWLHGPDILSNMYLDARFALFQIICQCVP